MQESIRFEWEWAFREVEMQRVWKKYFKDLYNVDTQEEVGVHVYDYDGSERKLFRRRTN